MSKGSRDDEPVDSAQEGGNVWEPLLTFDGLVVDEALLFGDAGEMTSINSNELVDASYEIGMLGTAPEGDFNSFREAFPSLPGDAREVTRSIIINNNSYPTCPSSSGNIINGSSTAVNTTTTTTTTITTATMCSIGFTDRNAASTSTSTTPTSTNGSADLNVLSGSRRQLPSKPEEKKPSRKGKEPLHPSRDENSDADDVHGHSLPVDNGGTGNRKRKREGGSVNNPLYVPLVPSRSENDKPFGHYVDFCVKVYDESILWPLLKDFISLVHEPDEKRREHRLMDLGRYRVGTELFKGELYDGCPDGSRDSVRRWLKDKEFRAGLRLAFAHGYLMLHVEERLQQEWHIRGVNVTSFKAAFFEDLTLSRWVLFTELVELVNAFRERRKEPCLSHDVKLALRELLGAPPKAPTVSPIVPVGSVEEFLVPRQGVAQGSSSGSDNNSGFTNTTALSSSATTTTTTTTSTAIAPASASNRVLIRVRPGAVGEFLAGRYGGANGSSNRIISNGSGTANTFTATTVTTSSDSGFNNTTVNNITTQASNIYSASTCTEGNGTPHCPNKRRGSFDEQSSSKRHRPNSVHCHRDFVPHTTTTRFGDLPDDRAARASSSLSTATSQVDSSGTGSASFIRAHLMPQPSPPNETTPGPTPMTTTLIDFAATTTTTTASAENRPGTPTSELLTALVPRNEITDFASSIHFVD